MRKIATLLALIFLLTSCIIGQVKNPLVVINTEAGDIELELYPEKAPVTTANFIRYIKASLFNNSSFYRIVRMDNQPRDSVKIEVIQGGRRDKEDNGFPPVIHETTGITGILHKDGVISMARSNPGTATSEFFICVGDQPALDLGGKRNKDGQGFAAFGKVTNGMDVVKKIHDNSAPSQYLEKPVKIYRIYLK